MSLLKSPFSLVTVTMMALTSWKFPLAPHCFAGQVTVTLGFHIQLDSAFIIPFYFPVSLETLSFYPTACCSSLLIAPVFSDARPAVLSSGHSIISYSLRPPQIHLLHYFCQHVLNIFNSKLKEKKFALKRGFYFITVSERPVSVRNNER